MDKETAVGIGWNWLHSYAQLSDKLYHLQQPTPVQDPELVVLNESLAAQLGLDIQALEKHGASILGGNEQAEGSLPLAQAYAGHQFGHFTMLGDGRALLLGEHATPSGQVVDIQLKGSGRTPYSRGGDGRAALGPMLREYIISEALHGLGIPTTRSLAVVETGETVQREKALPGAILTRVADSHIRVGTFQYAANWGGVDVLEQLVDYTVKRHYPEIASSDNKALDLLRAVIDKQSKLIAQWQLVGFIHGVMNTDNMAISGQSIDFGPCAFMNRYDPNTVFSSIDTAGRYAYRNQPQIAAWNLARLAEALLPLIDADSTRGIELAEEALTEFGASYRKNWLAGMRKKLGLVDDNEQAEELIFDLLEMLEQAGADYTNTFRQLTQQALDQMQEQKSQAQSHEGLEGQPKQQAEAQSIEEPQELSQQHCGASALERQSNWSSWQERWQQLRVNGSVSLQQSALMMKESNPNLIARNHIVEQVIASAVEEANYEPLEQFVAALREPYAYSDAQLTYVQPPAEQVDQSYVTYCGT